MFVIFFAKWMTHSITSAQKMTYGTFNLSDYCQWFCVTWSTSMYFLYFSPFTNSQAGFQVGCVCLRGGKHSNSRQFYPDEKSSRHEISLDILLLDLSRSFSHTRFVVFNWCRWQKLVEYKRTVGEGLTCSGGEQLIN